MSKNFGFSAKKGAPRSFGAKGGIGGGIFSRDGSQMGATLEGVFATALKGVREGGEHRDPHGAMVRVQGMCPTRKKETKKERTNGAGREISERQKTLVLF